MKERWFLFIGEGLAFGVGSKEGIITFVGPESKPCKPEWIGKQLTDTKEFLKEHGYKVIELKP